MNCVEMASPLLLRQVKHSPRQTDIQVVKDSLLERCASLGGPSELLFLSSFLEVLSTMVITPIEDYT